MNGSIALSLNSPITEEQWDIITDVDLDNTPSVIFQTKHGKEVEYVKVVRCKDCKWFNDSGCAIRIVDESDKPSENDFCSFGERRSECIF